MKKLLLLIALFTTFAASSQTDSSKKQHRHELGVDVTGLLNQFLNLNSNPYATYDYPVYLMSYRYCLKKGNIRFGVGGYYYKNPVVYEVYGFPRVFYNTQKNVSVRIGYEFVNQLSKKWQAFYGLDFRPGINIIDNQAVYSNSGYIYWNTENSTTYGFAPLLGFRYNLNDRVSILTEASFTYFTKKSETLRSFFSQDPALYPRDPDLEFANTRTEGVSFNPPIFLTLAVRL